MARVIVAVLVLLALAVGGYYVWQRSTEPLPLPPPSRTEVAPPAPAPSGPRHPVPAEAVAPQLPPLAESDAAVSAALGEALGAGVLGRFFVVEDLVRHFVATVDNLPRESVASRLNPAKPVPGPFRTTGKEASLAIAPENAARYSAVVSMVEAADARKLVDVYLRFYPLFQQAYVELGYPQGHFNDRLVEVIDHLLAAPNAKPPVRLEQPHVLYEYADDALETRSAGHKALIRVGPENADRLKAKLRAVRSELVARKAAS